MSRTASILILCALVGTTAYADDAATSATSSPQQGQARQFGIFFGGTASQYDLCVKKGFLAKGNQSAEEIAKAFLVTMPVLNRGQDLSAYVQDGWDTMKKEISEHESFYTQEKCAGVGKQWAKMLVTMRAK